MSVDPDPRSLLQGHVVLLTRDRVEFHAFMRGHQEPSLVHHADDRPFDVEFRHAQLGALDVALILSNCSLHAEARRRPDAPYVLQIPLTGEIHLQENGRPYTASSGGALLISPSRHIIRKSTPGATLVLRIDPMLLAGRMNRSPSSPRAKPALEPLLDGDVDAIRRFAFVIVDAIDRGWATRGSGVARVLELGLAELLLEKQRGGGISRRHPEASDAARRVLLVEAHVLEHLDAKLTAGQLAQIAGCSTRSLQLSFLRHCGMSPLQFARRRRLERARDWLTSDGPEINIGEIARRIGMAHLSHFARHYKDLYGELPSETRRRSRENSGG